MKKKTCHRNFARRSVRGLKQLFPSYTIERENEGRCENPGRRNNMDYFFICARLELFCDFLQFDWLHERAAFYDILVRGPKELFF